MTQTYAASMLTELLAAGPNGNEDFYRVKAMGRGSTNWFNASQAQLSAIAEIMNDGLPYSVGVTETCESLGRFKTADHAASFIGTLPDHESGIYYLDGPERRETN